LKKQGKNRKNREKSNKYDRINMMVVIKISYMILLERKKRDGMEWMMGDGDDGYEKEREG
jgi:hypothetical protein